MLVNSMSVKVAAKIQIIFTAAKLIALGIIIVGGIVRMAQGNNHFLCPTLELCTFRFNPQPYAQSYFDL